MDSPPPRVILLAFGPNKYNLFRISRCFFIICLDEKFRKELHAKHYLAVMNAFLRKLIFCFTVKILLVSYLSYVFLYEILKNVDVCFCAVVMLAQCEIFLVYQYILNSHPPHPQDWNKKGLSYCK